MKNLLPGIAGGVFVGIGLPIIFGLLRVPSFELGWTQTLAAGVGLLAVWYLAVAAHEAGHVLAGLLAGFRPYLIVVGPLKVERADDRWTIAVNRLSSWFGGFCAGIPRGAERLRQRLLLMIAGGPLTSLLSAVLGLVVFAVIRPDDSSVSIDGWRALPLIWSLGFGTVSLLLLSLSMMPTEHQGFASDGARILRFIRANDQVEAEVAVLTLCTASMAGQRPREWDTALLTRAQDVPLHSANGVVGAYLAHWQALDRGDLSTARQRLDDAIEHRDAAPPMMRACVALQAAKFHAAFGGDAVTARDWLERATPMTAASAQQRLVTEAAIAVVEGAPEASDLIARAASALARAQDCGCAAADGDLLSALGARLGRTAAA